MLATEDRQIQIRLKTADDQYTINQNVFSVSLETSPTELLDLIKNLLQIDDSEVDFHFRIDDEILQNTLGKYCEKNQFSGENILDIHYFPKRRLPDESLEISVNDWVSGLAFCHNVIYASLYNGQFVKVSSNGETLSFEAHSKPIKDIAFIKSETENEIQKDLIATASLDQNLMYHAISENKNEVLYVLKGHTETVTSCAVSPSNDQIASGSWDTFLKIWSTSLNEPCDDEQRKKRKKHTAPQPLLRTPVLTLGGHTQVITDVTWRDNSQIITSSHDMSIKLWDTQLMTCTDTLAINSSLQCVDWSGKAQLIAAGSSDKFVRLFDPRGSSGNIVHSTLIGHSLWVSDVTWSPSSDVELVSCSYDKNCLLWDIRSPKSPLSNLGTHDDKVLCVNWNTSGKLVSGGADNKIHILNM